MKSNFNCALKELILVRAPINWNMTKNLGYHLVRFELIDPIGNVDLTHFDFEKWVSRAVLQRKLRKNSNWNT